MEKGLRDVILNLALPLIEAQGLELWGLDLIPGPVLKVVLYVDIPLGQQGMEDSPSASIDQCESISRQLSLAMDVEDCIDQPWMLEVSSPGLERKFFALEQLRPYLGDILDIRLKQPLPGSDRKSWRGRLVALTGNEIKLEPVAIAADGSITTVSEASVILKWDAVAKARRLHIFTTPLKPGKHSVARKN